MLGTRFLILGTRIGSLKRLKKNLLDPFFLSTDLINCVGYLLL